MNKQNTLQPYVSFQTFMVVVVEMILFWVLTLWRVNKFVLAFQRNLPLPSSG